jgi:cystathionine gamma-lyase
MSCTVTIAQMLSHGDHIICVDDVYGGTQRYLRKIVSEKHGIDLTLIDFADEKTFKAAFKPKTKIVWLETPTNPTLKIFDIALLAKICKEKGVLFIVDNTFSTPYLCNPLDLGADIVVHSITKYIGGHSDVVMGCICLNDKKVYDDLFFIMKSIGTGACAFDCYLALRGSKTLAVRMERAQ